MGLTALKVHSAFSYLDGLVLPEELPMLAKQRGFESVALTDHMSLTGAVRFLKAAAAAGVRPILGSELLLEDGERLVLLVQQERGYRALSELLTRAHLASPRRTPRVSWSMLKQLHEAYPGSCAVLAGGRGGRLAAALLAAEYRAAEEQARRLHGLFGPEHLYLEVRRDALPGNRRLEQGLDGLAQRLSLRQVANCEVRYGSPQDFWVYDLLCCVRLHGRVDEPQPGRPLNAEQAFGTYVRLQRRFADRPELLAANAQLTERLQAGLRLGIQRFPSFVPEGGESPEALLRRLVWEGVDRRYTAREAGLIARVQHELAVIEQLGFAEYFLLVWDVGRFARQEGIRFAGRGSAADSVVAYALGLTEVDAYRRELLFERFLSPERAERPDIDIDFDSRHRDRVTSYVYERYGAAHVATVGTYSTFQARSAVRQLGQALGFTAPALERLSSVMPYVGADQIEAAWDRYPELQTLQGAERLRFKRLVEAAAKVAERPRFLGTHLGGVVITEEPLAQLTPCQPSAKGVVVTALDKRDVEDLGLLKLDLLSLRTLAVVDDSFKALPGLEQNLPERDQETFKLIRSGQTMGMFQLESPAQRALQGRLRANQQEDLVHALALIRPGPIKGNMVEPYLRRRAGDEPISYAHPLLEEILAPTYGVVLFQEQVIEIAIRVAGFTPGEADRLRRTMSHGRSQAEMDELGRLFCARANDQGLAAAQAAEIFKTMAGYASYGFCEAHAAAFAHTAYKTAYLLRHHPAQFYAALLSHQPMGFYPPHTLAVEARRRGLRFLPPDVNRSGVDFGVEQNALRVGLAIIRGVGREAAERLVQARQNGAFESLEDLARRAQLTAHSLEPLILAGALDGLFPQRRALLNQLYLRGAAGLWSLPPSAVAADFTAAEKAALELEFLGFEVQAPWIAALRPNLRRAGFCMSRDFLKMPRGHWLRIAGLPIRPHRPPTRSGRRMAFFSLEDEGGIVDVTVYEAIYRRYGDRLFTRPLRPLWVLGRVERRGRLPVLMAQQIEWLAMP